jgi:hypothetical protein
MKKIVNQSLYGRRLLDKIVEKYEKLDNYNYQTFLLKKKIKNFKKKDFYDQNVIHSIIQNDFISGENKIDFFKIDSLIKNIITMFFKRNKYFGYYYISKIFFSENFSGKTNNFFYQKIFLFLSSDLCFVKKLLIVSNHDLKNILKIIYYEKNNLSGIEQFINKKYFQINQFVKFIQFKKYCFRDNYYILVKTFSSFSSFYPKYVKLFLLKIVYILYTKKNVKQSFFNESISYQKTGSFEFLNFNKLSEKLSIDFHTVFIFLQSISNFGILEIFFSVKLSLLRSLYLNSDKNKIFIKKINKKFWSIVYV